MPSTNRFTPSINERRRSNLYFVQVILSWEGLSGGWAAFAALKGHRLDKLAYRRHTVTPIGITSVFEVLP